MTTHELKCWTQFFGPMCSGEKTFEIRLNDRDFQVGDTLHQRECEPLSHEPCDHGRVVGRYTGKWCDVQVMGMQPLGELLREIGYLITGATIPVGLVIMSTQLLGVGEEMGYVPVPGYEEMGK